MITKTILRKKGLSQT